MIPSLIALAIGAAGARAVLWPIEQWWSAKHVEKVREETARRYLE